MISISQLVLDRGGFHLECAGFDVRAGAYAVLMGPAGGGKTSVLECIAGLVKPRSGQIHVGDRDVTLLPAAERQIGYVPQDGALFTGLGVRANLEFSLRIRRSSDAAVKQRIDELSDLLEIGHLLGREVRDLSGGERQRIALGRALAFRPAVMLLDEPLSALDETSRGAMCSLLEQIQQETGTTFLHITHSAAEADRLATLRLDALELFRVRRSKH
ncbi:MAG: cysA [Akkermansiaceae bacterium]|nr:cysA [Akkermansiaceae bacterium]